MTLAQRIDVSDLPALMMLGVPSAKEPSLARATIWFSQKLMGARRLRPDRRRFGTSALIAWPTVVHESGGFRSPEAVLFEIREPCESPWPHVGEELGAAFIQPLAPLVSDALEMTNAAEKMGVKTQVGFNYLCNPMIKLAKEMITAGELGEIRSYRGIHAEDYMSNANDPFTFRHEPVGGGALADLGSHALATAEFLIGNIIEVMGDCINLISERPDIGGGNRAVRVDDIGRAFVRFSNGASGYIEGNWVATGRKMQHDFEIHGSKGALFFSQERLNELHFYSLNDAIGRHGFRKIEAEPNHHPYGNFCVAPGHQIGFNDLKAIEIAGYLNAIMGIGPEPFSFRQGMRIQHLIESIQKSSKNNRWIRV